MNTKPFPIDDAYPIVTPIDTYLRGLELFSGQCSRTQSYRNKDPGSNEFQEYLVWRQSMVIWACCTIEAVVNLEGVSWVGEEFYKKAIERQRIVDKIRLIYAIKYQRLLESDNETLKEVQTLFDSRNQFVHPKTREYSENEDEPSEDFKFLTDLDYAKLKKTVKSVYGIIKDPDDRT